jgi:hypothetical protein
MLGDGDVSEMCHSDRDLPRDSASNPTTRTRNQGCSTNYRLTHLSNSSYHPFKLYQASSSPKLNIVPNMASDAFQSHQHYPRNVEEFNQRFPDNAYNTIHNLAETNRRASGSRWNVKHLEACRVSLSQSQPRRPHPQPHHLTSPKTVS